MRRILALCLTFSIGAAATGPAAAQDEDAELWLNPSFTKAVDSRTEMELETAQRLRSSPRDDTYFVRLWLKRDDARANTWSLGAEQRWNDPDQREVRLLQQVGYRWGGLDFRTRMEQRFVSDDPDTGWRLRQRVGASVPLSSAREGWAFAGDAEVFVTLRPTEPNGQTGLTGLRTFVGFEREFDRYEVSVGYLRQQDIRAAGPDRIGHAPYLGLNVAF